MPASAMPHYAAGLQWQPGEFVGDGPQAPPPRMPVLAPARLESTAEAARDKGSSTGARWGLDEVLRLRCQTCTCWPNQRAVGQ